MPSAAPERGFGLIEVLVTLLVLSVGLLGVAGVHLRGIESSRMGYHRSHAVWIATELAERMRANRDGVANGCYESRMVDHAVTATATYGADCGSGAEGRAVADADLADVEAALRSDPPPLPGGRVTVSCPDLASDCTIIVDWQHDNPDSLDASQYVLAVRFF
ncbi:type IV pilus modification protein PilV [Inmirania thermothiophila]|uniref:Type IV pilus assembly protein PilV n=1 Tax=Inmirania thermothiophila TaxID=1750597 RepID=A0A3N1Y897_9GAMM|nr:type IV pilus modification protein PilV [Inmirania thermothiophila]ROR34990.1 type IV pilus assembly protein PilV [Inmirania thermothiophila]